MDGTACYYGNITRQRVNDKVRTFYHDSCFAIQLQHPGLCMPVSCTQRICHAFLCEHTPADIATTQRHVTATMALNDTAFDSDHDHARHDTVTMRQSMSSGPQSRTPMPRNLKPLVPVLRHAFAARGISLVTCPNGHVTHGFLYCDKKSSCGEKRSATRCNTCTTGAGLDSTWLADDQRTTAAQHNSGDGSNTGAAAFSNQPAQSSEQSGAGLVSVAMFECYSLGETVPYTLVCDFRRDCQDGSDETHCTHQSRTDAKAFRFVCTVLLFSHMCFPCNLCIPQPFGMVFTAIPKGLDVLGHFLFSSVADAKVGSK
jgi:hypothetical protein